MFLQARRSNFFAVTAPWNPHAEVVQDHASGRFGFCVGRDCPGARTRNPKRRHVPDDELRCDGDFFVVLPDLCGKEPIGGIVLRSQEDSL